MDGSRRKTKSLARHISRVTSVIVLVTVLVTGAVLVAVMTSASSRYLAARQAVALHSIEGILEARFETVSRVLEEGAASAPFSGAIDRRVALASAVDDPAGVCDYACLARKSGQVLAEYPSDGVALPNDLLAQAQTGDIGFQQLLPGGARRLWLVRAVRLSDGSSGVVTIRVGRTYLSKAVSDALKTAGIGTAVIVDARDTAVVGERGGHVVLASLKWQPQAASASGWVMARDAATGKVVQGPYTVSEGLPGVAWRIAVLEDSQIAFYESLGMLLPALTILLVGSAIALVVTWIIARRLVAPLVDLEAAALRGASGSYVKPLPTDRDDEIGRLAEAFNAVSLRLNALHDLSQLLASASRLDQVLDGILNAVGHIVGPGVSAVYLCDDTRALLVPECVKAPATGHPQPVPASGDGWLARTLVSEEPSTFDLPAELLADELPGLPVGSAQTAIAASLTAGHESLGVVVAVPQTGREFSAAELEMLRTFSAQAAVAVQNSRLFALESESRHIAEELRGIAEALVRPEGLQEAVNQVERAVCDLTDATFVRLAVVDRNALNMEPPPDRGFEAELLGLALRVINDFRGAQPQVLDPKDVDVAAMLERTGSKTLLVAPVSLDTEHGAVLVVGLPRARPGATDVDVIEAVRSELSLALDNAYFYGRAVSRAVNLETIFRISQVVGSSLQINVVLNRVLDIVQKILQADTVVLMTYEPSRRLVATDMARGQVSPGLLGLQVKPGEDIPGYVFSGGEPAAFQDLHTAMGGVGGEAAAHGLHSLIAVPLVARERSIGVLMAFSTEVGSFSDEDVSALQTFAAQAALAIDTARLYSREHELSQTLQASIMPEALPDLPEIEVGTVYVPASAPAADIGGDYFDAIRAPGGSIVLAMADVCGKGVEAATKTSMIKFSVRALVAAGFSPARVMHEVNRMVCESGLPGDIVTLWVGALDAETGVLSWADGGHPPAMLRRATGVIERLGPTGPLLGAVASVDYEEERLSVGAGDTLVLYTDGVTEARSGNKLFGEERLRRCLEAPADSQGLADRVLDSVRTYSRGELRDDIAILVAKIRPHHENVDNEETDQ